MNCLTENELFVLEKNVVECADFEALLFEYVEGEIAPSVRARIDSHLHVCAECQHSLNSYQLTIDLARTLRMSEGGTLQPEQTPTTNAPSASRDIQNRLRSALNLKLGLRLPTLE